MGRFRNVNSGAIVSVRDDKVLDVEWQPLDGPPKRFRPTSDGSCRATPRPAQVCAKLACAQASAQVIGRNRATACPRRDHRRESAAVPQPCLVEQPWHIEQLPV